MHSLVSRGDIRVPVRHGEGGGRFKKTAKKQSVNISRGFDQTTEGAVPSVLWLVGQW